MRSGKTAGSDIGEKNNWYELIMKVYDLDPGVRAAFLRILS